MHASTCSFKECSSMRHACMCWPTGSKFDGSRPMHVCTADVAQIYSTRFILGCCFGKGWARRFMKYGLDRIRCVYAGLVAKFSDRGVRLRHSDVALKSVVNANSLPKRPALSRVPMSLRAGPSSPPTLALNAYEDAYVFHIH